MGNLLCTEVFRLSTWVLGEISESGFFRQTSRQVRVGWQLALPALFMIKYQTNLIRFFL